MGQIQNRSLSPAGLGHDKKLATEAQWGRREDLHDCLFGQESLAASGDAGGHAEVGRTISGTLCWPQGSLIPDSITQRTKPFAVIFYQARKCPVRDPVTGVGLTVGG